MSLASLHQVLESLQQQAPWQAQQQFQALLDCWPEVVGPVVDRLRATRAFSPTRAVSRFHPGGPVEEALEVLHRGARRAGAGFDPSLSAAALAVLAAWANARSDAQHQSANSHAIRRVEAYLEQHLSEPVDLKREASRFGLSYSGLRRSFARLTGCSPWRYVLRLRINRARRLLATTDLTVEAIALQLGFGSAFHLSTTFTRWCGKAPTHWRKEWRQKSVGATEHGVPAAPVCN